MMARKYVWKDPLTKNHKRLNNAARLMERAQARGDIKYQGPDCLLKHGGVRYAQSGRCVECEADRLKARRLAARIQSQC